MGAQIRTSQSLTTAIAAIPAGLSALVLWWLIDSGKWNIFGIWTLDSTTGEMTGFGDLAFITAVADCYAAESAGVQVDLDTCDPYGRPFSPYGIIPGKFLAFFNVGFDQNTLLGVLLAGVWVVLVFGLTLKVTRNWSMSRIELGFAILFISALAISPTVMLAVERGTLDIVVAALAALGLIGFASGGAVRHTGSALLLFVSVIIKYFAVGVFAPFFAPRRWSAIGIIGAAATLAFLLINFENLRSAQEIAQADTQSTTRIMFSSTTGIITFLVENPNAFFPPADQVLNIAFIQSIAIGIFVLLVMGFLVLLARNLSSSSVPTVSWFLIVGGSFALTIPYFLGPSNDYRLVLLLLPLIGISLWIGQNSSRAIRISLWVVAGAMVIAALTGSSMQPNEFGFVLPKSVVILGDAALATALAFGVALFIHAWLPKKWKAS